MKKDFKKILQEKINGEYKESVRTKSDNKVKEIGKDLGFHVVSNSGATPWEKSDLTNEHFTIEHKYTDKEQFIIKKDELIKLIFSANSKTPIFMIEFDKMEMNVSNKWALIPYNVFKELIKD